MQQKDQIAAENIAQRSLRDRVGVFVVPTETSDALATIREAERAGVQQIWTGEADRADPLTLFAIAAAQTERIRLGTSILAVYSRHPVVLARQALAIHDIAPGRLRLGIGSGGRAPVEQWLGLSQISPLPYLKEYVEILRTVLWEGGTNYEGTFFKIALPAPRPAQIPLYVSALGKQAFRLAGEIADGVLPWMCPAPYLLNQALPALRAGAEATERPVPPIVAHMHVALSTDKAAALAASRRWVQMYARLSTYARMFAHAGFAGAVDGSEADVDALARSLVISGDEATVRSRIQEVLASGLDELQLQLLPIADEARERAALLHLVGSL